MTGHECNSGWIEANHYEQLRMRARAANMTEEQFEEYFERFAGARFMKRCPRCWADQVIRDLSPDERNPCTWESWHPVESLAEQVKALKRWRGGFQNWTFVLCGNDYQGNYGTGKTHVCIATCAAWILEGRSALYFDSADIIESRRMSFEDKSLYDPRIEESSGLVTIDDLGKEADTQWTRETIDRIIDRRYRNRKPTFITTNLSRDGLTRRYPRTMSRLGEGMIFEWVSEDRRSFRPSYKIENEKTDWT